MCLLLTVALLIFAALCCVFFVVDCFDPQNTSTAKLSDTHAIPYKKELSLFTTFFLKSDCLAMGVIGWESTLSLELSDALPTVLENLKERLAASGPQSKVGERMGRLATSSGFTFGDN